MFITFRPIIKVWVRAREKKRTQTFWEKALFYKRFAQPHPRAAAGMSRGAAALWDENGFFGEKL